LTSGLPNIKNRSQFHLSAHAFMDCASKSEEARCHCGHLVAKLRRTGVELKCKRCKRLLLIPFARELPKLLSSSSAIAGGNKTT
jgi:hypothetical protein